MANTKYKTLTQNHLNQYFFTLIKTDFCYSEDSEQSLLGHFKLYKPVKDVIKEEIKEINSAISRQNNQNQNFGYLQNNQINTITTLRKCDESYCIGNDSRLKETVTVRYRIGGKCSYLCTTCFDLFYAKISY